MLILAQLAISASFVAQSGLTDGYMNHAALSRAVADLAASSGDVTARSIGKSVDGRDLHLLTLSGNADEAGSRPALLIVAGVDARHLVGTETAIRVARGLVNDHADLLDDFTVYVIPRVNPDGAEKKFGGVLTDGRGNSHTVDEDRDGNLDEDPPTDLNGDGLITMMRRVDPPLDTPATHLVDPDDPRLMKTPDRDEGETANYVLYIEGRDADGDGMVAEDGPGVTDLDHNFPHEYDDHALDGGAFPLSEPESLALAQFVIEHRNIVAAIVYGRHDTVINVPDGRGNDSSGEGPKNINSSDVDLYETISDIYKEATDQTNAPKEDGDGSLHAWLNAQRGIPTAATVVWGRPGAPSDDDDDAGGGDDAGRRGGGGDAGDDGDGDMSVAGTWTGTASVPEMGDIPVTITIEQGDGDDITGSISMMGDSMDLAGTYGGGHGSMSGSVDFGGETISVELTIDHGKITGILRGPDGVTADVTATRDTGFSQDPGGRGRRGGRGGGGGVDAPSGPARRNTAGGGSDDAAWLTYSDDVRGGAGFVEWQPFNHPELGEVEIGGFAPLFRMNPPSDKLDGLASKQLAFALKMMEQRPSLRIIGPEVSKLSNGLYDVRIAVVNDGAFPTKTAQARRTRTTLPTIVRISTPVDGIITGDRVSREYGIDGKGGRFERHWIIRAKAGDEVTITVHDEQLGEQTVSFTAN